MSDATVDPSDPYTRPAQTFPRLSPENLATVQRYGKEAAVTAGTLVFQRGDRGADFFVVLEGSIEIFDVDPWGGAHVVGNGVRSMSEVCEHIRSLKSVKVGPERVCEECVKTGGSWLHLRTCQTCGGTRCCDSSPNQHASKHAAESGHPVVASAEPGEAWLWCYPDEELVEYG